MTRANPSGDFVTVARSVLPGYLGVTYPRPSMGYNQYSINYRFDSKTHADTWQNSTVRKDWIARLDGTFEGKTRFKAVDGLESWFDLPTILIEQHPVRWRMCVVLMIVVSIQVMLMTYLVIPRVTAHLKGWLYR
ncbi:MAG: hypothetical protein ABGY43_03155 [bacterium]|jgi:antibiotic biosynthesis monooxygenase (ABM) superfamily enzyme|nr:hypothetical protein [Gammaproteobacteria bacterium]HIL85332.1 hypothetical protein [Pseudomonadales bacterium]